ncbi:hypothetical protein KXQ82_18530 [Mucilaginibacter sp. HMF5004]|nr:hypothetical protein [Mucilaginibacter rivuli]MBW4891728.1 hypothetical protein [Mucilaginibacter rivuli]
MENSFNYIPEEKTTLMDDLKEAVAELNLVLTGKLEARDADELLDEL